MAHTSKYTMPLYKFEPHLRQLLTSGKVFGRCAVFFSHIPAKSGFVTFNSWMDYPDIFTSIPLDVDGAEIRMSGMFGEITCQFLDGKWSTISYAPRRMDSESPPEEET